MVFNLGFIKITIERPGSVREQVETELKRGRLYAIKKHRELTGSSLANAVHYVNEMLPEKQRIHISASMRDQ